MTDPLAGPDPFDHHYAPDVCGLEGAPLAEPSSLGLHVPVGDEVLDLGSPEADLDPASPPPPPARWERIDHGHI